MAQDIYVDTTGGGLVLGTTNPAAAQPPRFVQGDQIWPHIYLLKRTSTYPLTNPFTVITDPAIALKVALTDPGGSASTVYASQYTWTRDAENQYFLAVGGFSLNTTPIGTLLGTSKSATAYFEIEYADGGFPTTALLLPCTILADGIKAGGATVPVGETVLTVEVANAMFLKNDNNGHVITNPNTGLKYFLYVDDNGTLKCDPIT